MPKNILLISFKKVFVILSGLVLILFMAGCGGGGGGGEEPPPQPLPVDSVIVAGTVDDGTANSPISNAKCAFVDLNGDNLGQTLAGTNGNFSINVLPDKEGHIRCSPPGIPKLILSTYLSTKGRAAGDKISGEDLTPATKVVADIIDSENADLPLARKLELLAAIENGDPELSLLVNLSTKLFKEMLVRRINVRFGSEGAGGDGFGGEGAGGDGDGGGAGGDAGDGADASPIPAARCDFALDLEGEVLFHAALEDLRDGQLNRPDLAAIKDEVDQEFQDPQMRQDIKEAFDKWFPVGVGKSYSDVADDSGRYFLPIPPNVEGFVRCTPPDQPQLKLATFLPKLEEGQKVDNQDVTPATTFFSHSIATKLSNDLETVKENYLADTAGLGDIHIVEDGEEITGFQLLSGSDPQDNDVGLVAFSATSLFNILYKNEIDVDYLAALDGLIDNQTVRSEDLESLGIPKDDAEKWSAVVNTSNEDAGDDLGTTLNEALSKARIRVKVTDRPGGDGIPKARVNTDPPGIVVCDNCPAETGLNGEVILTLTGVPETEAIQIEVEASLVPGFEPTRRTTQVVAFATVDLEIALTPEFLLQVTKTGTGGGTVTSSPAGISCGTDCTQDYTDGTVVSLTAQADTDSNFTGWSGDPDCADGQVTMDSAITCTAAFALIPPTQHTLQVTKTGTGGGTLTSSPAGISCGTDCTQDYIDGTVVSLTATANAGSNFTGWSGDPDCSDGQVTMDSAITCTAAFALIPSTQHNTLQVTKTGTGSGTVTSSPAGISCGTDCTQNYIDGMVVSLTATANADSNFTGWSGGGCSGTSPCTVTMTQARTVTANFAGRFTLTVQGGGNGTGVVASSPSGINCSIDGTVESADCSELYSSGTQITLSADPTGGSTFSGWSGGGCSGTSPCIVTMDQAQTVTANFAGRFTLTVQGGGNGTGFVSSTPSGISCSISGTVESEDCSELYGSGTQVTLTTDPTGGSIFSGWSGGGCSGTSPCTVTMNQARTVTANFTLPLPPTISNISQTLVQENADFCVNSSGTFTGTIFDIRFEYADVNGDVSKSGGATVDAGFDATTFSTFSGDGFSGSITSNLCFAGSSRDVTMTLTDNSGLSSNSLTVRVNP